MGTKRTTQQAPGESEIQESGPVTAIVEPPAKADGRSLAGWQRALFIPLTILAWLAVLIVVGWLMTHLVKTILTLIFAGIVAFALTPLVNLLGRWMPRGLAIAAAYLLGFTIIFGMLALVIVTAADQVTTFVHAVPGYAQQLQAQ